MGEIRQPGSWNITFTSFEIRKLTIPKKGNVSRRIARRKLVVHSLTPTQTIHNHALLNKGKAISKQNLYILASTLIPSNTGSHSMMPEGENSFDHYKSKGIFQALKKKITWVLNQKYNGKTPKSAIKKPGFIHYVHHPLWQIHWNFHYTWMGYIYIYIMENHIF